IAQLDRELDGGRLFRGSDGERCYVVLMLEDAGQRLAGGIRKLGHAPLKGLGKLPVYEIVDAAEFDPAALTPVEEGERLVTAVEREFANALGGGGRKRWGELVAHD